MNKRLYAKTKVMVVLGTQLEALKAAPIVDLLNRQENDFETIIVATAHPLELLDQALSLFHLHPDIVLNFIHSRPGLPALTSRVLESISITLHQTKPDILLLQGDTTTAFASALAAFYQHIPVGHIASSMRTDTNDGSFPEEMNRHLTTVMTEIHFAPTPFAKETLMKEGVSEKRIVVTGNTLVDALRYISNISFTSHASPLQHLDINGQRLVLVTTNQPESWNAVLQNICEAVKELVLKYSDIVVVCTIKPDSIIRDRAAEILGGVERIHLIDAPDVVTFVNLMKKSYLIITDSADLSEKASTFRKPLLLLNAKDKQVEDAHTVSNKVMELNPTEIVQEAGSLLNDAKAYQKLINLENFYGDGHAAKRIVSALSRCLKGKQPLITPFEEFTSQAAGLKPLCQNH